MDYLKDNKNKIIVVGRNYCNILIVARDLGKAG